MADHRTLCGFASRCVASRIVSSASRTDLVAAHDRPVTVAAVNLDRVRSFQAKQAEDEAQTPSPSQAAPRDVE